MVAPGVLAPIMIGNIQDVTPQLIAGTGLGNTLVNILALSIGTTFCNGLDSLVPQAHGAKKPTLCARYLVQARIILVALTFLLVPCIWYGESILIGLGQDPIVSMYAGQYAKWSMPGILPYFLCSSARKFLRNINEAKIVATILLVTVPFHLLWLNIFVRYLDLKNGRSRCCKHIDIFDFICIGRDRIMAKSVGKRHKT